MNYLLTKGGASLAGIGIIWAAYRATSGLDLSNDPVRVAAGAILAQRGLIELCAIGILMWVIGKWRSHTVVR